MRLFPALVAVLIAGCTPESSPPASPQTPTQQQPQPPSPGGPAVQPLTMVVLTATTGFRHTDGINAAKQVLPQMSARTGEFTVFFTEDLADITADRLAKTNVLFFALTTGELPFTDAQKTAIVNFVNQGGGFMGAHSATDTLYDWADYGKLVGAYFNGHPWTQEATVTVEGGSHPATRDLGSS